MNNIIKLFLIAALTTTIPFVGPSTANSSGILDGKQFVAIVDGDEDVLTFQDGTFHSSSCDEYGFGRGDYIAQNTEDGIAFEAKTSSEKHGQMVWTGTVKGDKIEGSYHWTKKGWLGTKEKTKNFEGNIKK